MQGCHLARPAFRHVLLCLSLFALAGCATLPDTPSADCSADAGFRLGLTGRGSQVAGADSCPAAFHAGYEKGRAAWLARDRRNRIHSEIYELQRDRTDLEQDKHDKLAALARSGLSPGERVDLLYEIHRIDARRAMLAERLDSLERELGSRQAQSERPEM